MRYKFIIKFILLFSLMSYGQIKYKSFIHPGVTKWLYYSPQDGCLIDEIDAFGDTVINQLTYKKLWRTYFVPTPPYVNANQQWREYRVFSSMVKSFIRQSSDSSKLYLFDEVDNVEYLIVDMNLKVGDAIKYPFGNDTVESVIYMDGLKSIQFKKLNAAWDKLTFVESVGHNIHILSTMKNFAFPPNVLICYSNSSYFYNTFSICGCVDTKTKEIETGKYKIRRHSDLIEISFAEIFPHTWKLYDIFGKIIQRSDKYDNTSIKIPIIGDKNKVFLLRIFNLEKNEYMTLKIIY